MKKLLFISLLTPILAHSYPLFFKCDADGRLSDQITPKELQGRLTGLVDDLKKSSPELRKKKIEDICEGSVQCLRELRTLLELSEISGKITKETIDSQMAQITETAQKTQKNLNGIAKIPEGVFSSAAQYVKVVENVALARECRVASSKIDPSEMELDNGTCVLANFGHSPYMYPAGIRVSDGKTPVRKSRSSLAVCSALKDVITAAVSMDQDPYATLAVSLMENGTAVQRLYLDPIGAVETIGCESSKGSAKSNNLVSYGTYYNVKYKTFDNPKLANHINDYLKLSTNKAPEKGTSYVCAGFNMNGNDDDESLFGDTGCNGFSSTASFCEKPMKGSCCAILPFKVDPEFAETASKAIVYSSLDKYLKAPLKDQIKGSDPTELPARRLQRFNGYSDSMGGAEGVSTWRAGVNYFKTPAYGYQATDFILNTLWNNPFIRKAVEDAEEKLNRKSKSVMCQDRGPGVYTMEHDLFFQKHANSPRMETIKNRWQSNPDWKALAKRHKNVLLNELKTYCRSKNVMDSFKSNCEGDFDDYDEEKDDDNDPEIKANRTRMNNVVTSYFKNVFPLRNTIAKASKMDENFTWTEMDDEKLKIFKSAFQNSVKPGSSYLTGGMYGGGGMYSGGMTAGMGGGYVTGGMLPQKPEEEDDPEMKKEK